ncbi:MAG TPA: DUF1109 domain-containing protein [Dongiaceae bacterium]|jgi:hypothetical protein|nr:DUF1109 domain-containing protein [Dongiaceae bacterium]
MTGTPDLIRQLTAEAEAVRRLRPPLVRAGLWVIIGAVILTAVATAIGLRPDLGLKLRDPVFVIEIASAALTGITAAIAAFHVSIPDRSARWALLPLPTLLVWLSTVGYGCLTNWVALGPGGTVPGLSIPCLETIALGSTPLAVILYFMLRHARFVRPLATASVAAVAVAGLTVSALRLFHELDATVMVLIWNVGAGAVMTLVGAMFGRRGFLLPR